MKTKPPPKRGRPTLPKGDVKAKIVLMRLNDEDTALFADAARANNQTLSTWMRNTLRVAATTQASKK